jgi:hypothetical protein
MVDLKKIIGKKFNKWTVIDSFNRKCPNSKYHTVWLKCQCECGRIKDVYYHNIITGQSKSCGCYRRQQPTGSDSPSWKGGRHITEQGYVEIYKKEHPRAKTNGYVKEHTLVMEEHLGRYLIKGENVHHINGVRMDNRIENLELWNTSQPCGQRVEDKLKWAKEIIKLYGKTEGDNN